MCLKKASNFAASIPGFRSKNLSKSLIAAEAGTEDLSLAGSMSTWSNKPGTCSKSSCSKFRAYRAGAQQGHQDNSNEGGEGRYLCGELREALVGDDCMSTKREERSAMPQTCIPLFLKRKFHTLESTTIGSLLMRRACVHPKALPRAGALKYTQTLRKDADMGGPFSQPGPSLVKRRERRAVCFLTSDNCGKKDDLEGAHRKALQDRARACWNPRFFLPVQQTTGPVLTLSDPLKEAGWFLLRTRNLIPVKPNLLQSTKQDGDKRYNPIE